MTLVTPLLFGMLIFAPGYLDSISSDLDQEVKNIAIVEENIFFSDKLMNSEIINFTQVPKSEIELIKNNFSESSYYAIIEIENDEQINIISEKQINKSTLDQIENQIYKIKEYQNFNEANIDVKLLNSLSPNLSFNYMKIDESAQKQNFIKLIKINKKSKNH